MASVLIGGVLAALLATAVNQYLKGRRVTRERGELSEFYHSVHALLANDASCQAVLSGVTFSPVGELALKLPAGFGENTHGPIEKGFKFAKDSLQVDEFTLEDKGIPPVSFDLLGKPVTRYMARVTVKVNGTDGTEFRPRYFEFPILVDSESHVIRACNNQFNISDACEALGFSWDQATASCQPSSACLAGGTYTIAAGGLFGGEGCKISNPITRSCSCPAGYEDVASGTVDIAQHCGHFCFSSYSTVHECFRCPQ